MRKWCVYLIISSKKLWELFVLTDIELDIALHCHWSEEGSAIFFPCTVGAVS